MSAIVKVGRDFFHSRFKINFGTSFAFEVQSAVGKIGEIPILTILNFDFF